jgi:hypothetical protein
MRPQNSLVGEPAMRYVARWRMQRCPDVAQGRRRAALQSREPTRLRVRGRVQSSLQMFHRRLARRSPADWSRGECRGYGAGKAA